MNDPGLTRRDQLLVDGALHALDGPDQPAFAALLRDPAAAAEFAALERAAALVAIADCAADDLAVGAAGAAVCRDPLEARVWRDAVVFFAGRAPRPAPTMPGRHEPAPGRRLPPAVPWLLAAAALVALLWPRQPAPLPPERARANLLASATPLVRCDWTPGPSPQRGEVRGDVVFDPAQQCGFLRLSGLPELDAEHRYQLWIVDGQRQGPPVDGGLLAPLPGAGEVVLPIQARLPVRTPAAFVLTVEDAAGVVVSAQQHVVAIARP